MSTIFFYMRTPFGFIVLIYMSGLAGGVAMRSLCIATLLVKASERSGCVATTLTFYF